MNKVCKLFIAYVFLVCALFAEKEELPDDYVTVSCTTLSLGKAISNIKYFDGCEWIPFIVPNGARSQEFIYKGPMKMKFSLKIPTGEVIQLDSVSFTKEHKQAMLIFVPMKERKGLLYRVKMMDETNLDFPANSYRFVNFTPKVIAGQINEKKFAVKTHDGVTVKLSELKDESRITMAFFEDGTWKPLYRSIWGAREDTRILVLVIPRGGNSNRITIRKFVDQPPKE